MKVIVNLSTETNKSNLCACFPSKNYLAYLRFIKPFLDTKFFLFKKKNDFPIIQGLSLLYDAY